ncbi:MAG TPA: toll/interleukin-1 receptor domain-containing protein [Phototrophicaceae bacterium]|nr:toll/interleukin-1 receptor domain-containing protein [Phototrophicaceae bacterium]
MELFLSYRRTNWPFAQQLANALRIFIAATLFVDYQSIDETDFEVSILGHLRKSDAVLLIVSKDTFDPARIHRDDDWVRREVREALTLKKPIVVVLVDGQLIPADIPQDIQNIRRMEGVKFYPEYFEAGVKRLADFIEKATPIRSALLDDEDETVEARTPLEDAVEALNQGDYDRALVILEGLRDDCYASPVVSIVDMIGDVKRRRESERRRQQALAAYRDIRALARSKVMLERAREAWITFQAAYPDFNEDTDNLAEKLKARGIEEIIASGSNRNPAALSLDDVLSYFVNTPVDTSAPVRSTPRPKNSADV